jgi:hypothetical protein
MSLKTRLARLERKVAVTASDPFPGWELLEGDVKVVECWLKKHRYANPLEAVAAGQKDYFLEWYTFEWWLQEQGYANASETLEAGVVAPPGLENELAYRAAVDYYHEVYGYVLTYRPCPPSTLDELFALRDQVGTGLESRPRWVAALPALRQLAERLREATEGASRQRWLEEHEAHHLPGKEYAKWRDRWEAELGDTSARPSA